MSEVSIREFSDRTADPAVRGFLHVPENANGNGLILTHGAGANAQAPLLRSLADTFTAAGFTVLRCDLPFRQVRSFGPPGPGDAARDRAGLKNAIAALMKTVGAPLLPDFGRSGEDPKGGTDETGNLVAPPFPRFVREGGDSPQKINDQGSIFLAGHSYGGRQASMLCAEEPDIAAGLLLLSYPLHPPRRPEQQRTQHLPDLRMPTLFVHGTRDPFGTIAELERAMKMIPGKTKLLPVEGAGHDLGFKGKARKEELPKLVISEFAKFIGLSS